MNWVAASIGFIGTILLIGAAYAFERLMDESRAAAAMAVTSAVVTAVLLGIFV